MILKMSFTDITLQRHNLVKDVLPKYEWLDMERRLARAVDGTWVGSSDGFGSTWAVSIGRNRCGRLSEFPMRSSRT